MAQVDWSSGEKLTLYELIEKQGYLSLDSMEGGVEMHRPPSVEGSRWRLGPGIFLACGVTAVAAWLSRAPFPPFTMEGMELEHPLGVSFLSILLGLAVGGFASLGEGARLGCRWVAYWLIPVAIVCLGAQVDAGLLGGMAWGMGGVVIGVMVFAVASGVVVGRLLGLGRKGAYLLGVGTAVCGSSAVMAVAPVMDAEDDEVVLAIGAVNLVGLLAMMTCVSMLWIFPLGAELYGTWAGATIHAVPQVVAAGQSHGVEAAAVATMVKLIRVSLLVPVVLVTAFLFQRDGADQGDGKAGVRWGALVPWFVWGFIGMALLRALGWVPVLMFADETVVDLSEFLGAASRWLLAVAMAAIGLQVNFRAMMRDGRKAIFAAVLVWALVAGVALFALWLVTGV